jgi:TolA-binding protein
LQQGKYVEAGKAFEQVVRDHPKFEFVDESHLNLGWCQYSAAINGQADQFAAAEKTFTEFLKAREESKLRDQALFYLGECLYLQGKKQASEPVYRELVDQHPDSKLRADAFYALGVAQQESGEAEAAIRTIDSFLRDFPDHELATEMTMRKAESLIRLERFADAEPLFAEIVKNKEFVDYHHALFRRAFCVLKQNRYRDAAELYGAIPALVTEPAFAAAAAVAAGRAYYQAGDIDEATKWLEKAAQQPSTKSEATHWLCRIAIQNKEFDGAQRLAADALARAKADDPYAPTLQLDLADAVYETADGKQKALDDYLKIAKDHGQTEAAPQALYNAAYAAMELEKYGEAIQYAAEFEQRFAQHRLLPDAQYVAAESLLLSRKYAEAEGAYAALADKYPQHNQNSLWRLRYAAALQIQDKHEAALVVVNDQLNSLKDPQLIAEAHYLAGYSHAKLGQNNEAVKSYEASLRSSTQWRRADDAVLQLSQTLTTLGNNEEAKRVFTRYKTSIEKSDRPDAVRYQLAETNYESELYEEALREYDGLLQQWPDSEFAASALFGKAWAQFKLGNPGDAVKTFTALIDGHAGHELIPRAYRARAMCRQLSGDPRGGIADVSAYLATNPPEKDQAEAYYVRGLCESALGDTAAARETYMSILAKYDDYVRRDRVLYEMAWLHKSAQEGDEAAARFAELVKQYPDSRLAGEAHYHLAERAYAAQDFAAAIDGYSAALAAAPSAEIAERAMYKRGWCEYQRKSYEPALNNFREQVERFADGKLYADGQFMIVECLFQLDNHEQTITAFRQLDLAKLPEQSRVLSQLHAGQSAVQLEQWQLAVEFLEPLVAENQTSLLANQASFELGRAFQGLERTADAEKLYKQVAEQSRNSVGARSQFMLGELYFAGKDFELALQEFQRLMYGFGGDRAPASIKPWQAKAGLEAGRVAAILAGQKEDKEERVDLVIRAKKYFQYVIDQHQGTDEATAAATQLQKLGS